MRDLIHCSKQVSKICRRNRVFQSTAKDLETHRLSVTSLKRPVLCKSLQSICVWAHSHLYFLLQIAWGQLPYHLQDTMWCLNQTLARSLKQLRSHKWEAKYGGSEVWHHQDSNHGITEWWPSFFRALCMLSLGRMLSLLLTSSERIWKERTRHPLSKTAVLTFGLFSTSRCCPAAWVGIATEQQHGVAAFSSSLKLRA